MREGTKTVQSYRYSQRESPLAFPRMLPAQIYTFLPIQSLRRQESPSQMLETESGSLEQTCLWPRAALGCLEFIPGRESGFSDTPGLAGCHWAGGGLFAAHSEVKEPQTHFCPCSLRLLVF